MSACGNLLLRTGFATLILMTCSGSGCGGSNPIEGQVGEGTVVAQVGPGGAVLRGDGSTALAGLELTIPEGALDQLVQLRIEVGPDLSTAGTDAASAGISIQVSPDPGVLLVPATLTIPVDLQQFRDPVDLLAVNRIREAGPQGLPAEVRPGLAAAGGTYDSDTERFTFDLVRLADMQVRVANQRRLVVDAEELVMSGYEAMAALTDQGLEDGLSAFQAATAADPFSPSARLFTAVGSVLFVLNDRTDDGPGLDSIGEALQRSGLDVAAMSLWERSATGQWPQQWVVPPGAPLAVDWALLLRSRVRPALENALEQLDLVPENTAVLIVLPAAVTGLSGPRELDAADILTLRALLHGLIFAIDWFEDTDLESDVPLLTATRAADPFEDLLARYPLFGTPRARTEERTLRAFASGVRALLAAFASLAAETDGQENDLVTFARSFTADRQARWQANLRGILDSVSNGGARTLAAEGGIGALQVDWSLLFAAPPVDLRAAFPAVRHGFGLADSLGDPTLGGVLPGMDGVRAAGLLRLANDFALGGATLTATGNLAEWPGTSRALRPDDPAGDVTASLDAVDLRAVFAAQSGDYLGLRCSVYDGSIGPRLDQVNQYRFNVDTVGSVAEAVGLGFDVLVDAQGVALTAWRNGQVIPVRFFVNATGNDLELLVNRFDITEPDEPVSDRVLRVESEVLQLSSGAFASDRTRPILLRF